MLEAKHGEMEAEIARLREQINRLTQGWLAEKESQDGQATESPSLKKRPFTARDRLQVVVDELIDLLNRYGHEAPAIGVNALIKIAGANQLGVNRILAANAKRIEAVHEAVGITDTRQHNADLTRPIRLEYENQPHPQHGHNWLRVALDRVRAKAKAEAVKAPVAEAKPAAVGAPKIKAKSMVRVAKAPPALVEAKAEPAPTTATGKEVVTAKRSRAKRTEAKATTAAGEKQVARRKRRTPVETEART
jgi:hypothetical protein